ncbi:alpha/beta hydrolase [Paenarthrobacter aurescens]|uniref:Alpha/beta hydrolase n=1 Tax=Paenarthrobacter aurescens TaxID=43663 RepID=A0A4Y3NDS0_PAEAU|nr:alpha/beta hydrolase [Paenarthrobacter aurescens]MDO6143667.1 alpha/beta hydrolase [Paenarthrobacter aurescens]MDO6147515.1 alpha/beta hydrolase [Paenarthrobacter aurescens]MDO6158758.1 alpha/beta hydrolase [Paenarthrobacter aurescens]MDO6162742.1 alpha/beta hydrolase [Paenarthrobacter aurescens]GEB19317.1 alpha/beta hydrolase [Paenarthrobacter aurescens]
MEWTADILGPDFQSCGLDATGVDGVSRHATLIRHRLPSGKQTHDDGQSPPKRTGAVLFLHGWSDYFFNTELAGFWAEQGYDFYALDMHNHGRSLQADMPGGYVASLTDYDAEIEKAIHIIHGDRPDSQKGSLTLMGHSTGGLVAALWASRHPDDVQYLILDSPWLEMHGSSLVRRAAQAMVSPIARLRPETVLRLPERGFYFRSISSTAEGEWTLDENYRPPLAFPVRAGWLSAVFAGHSQVARGLKLEMPVLVLTSTTSANGMVWQESMRRSDAVLDVSVIALRAMALGRTVTLERIDGALHDVFLSAPAVRKDAYARLARWVNGFMDTNEPGHRREGDT